MNRKMIGLAISLVAILAIGGGIWYYGTHHHSAAKPFAAETTSSAPCSMNCVTTAQLKDAIQAALTGALNAQTPAAPQKEQVCAVKSHPKHATTPEPRPRETYEAENPLPPPPPAPAPAVQPPAHIPVDIHVTVSQEKPAAVQSIAPVALPPPPVEMAQMTAPPAETAIANDRKKARKVQDFCKLKKTEITESQRQTCAMEETARWTKRGAIGEDVTAVATTGIFATDLWSLRHPSMVQSQSQSQVQAQSRRAGGTILTKGAVINGAKGTTFRVVPPSAATN